MSTCNTNQKYADIWEEKDKFQFIATSEAGFGAGTPQQEHFKNAGALLKCSLGGAQHFQELKICAHGTVLACYAFHRHS